MEKRQEPREQRHVSNNQCNSIEKEQRLIRSRDLDRLRRERESNKDAQERLAFIIHDLVWYKCVIMLDLFFKHNLICYCVGNCNIAHAGWLGAGSMKEVDMKQ